MQQAGGYWNGDVLTIDWDELDAAEVARERAEGGVTLRRVKAKEVLMQRHGYSVEGFRFPLVEKALKQLMNAELYVDRCEVSHHPRRAQTYGI